MDEGLHKLPQNPVLHKLGWASKTSLYIPNRGLPTFHPLHVLGRKTENTHRLLSALLVIMVSFSRISKQCFQEINVCLFFPPLLLLHSRNHTNPCVCALVPILSHLRHTASDRRSLPQKFLILCRDRL